MAEQDITIDEVRNLLDDISSHDFRTKPMGYDNREVDEYLDSVNDTIQRILDYMVNVREQLQQAYATRPAAPAPAAPAPAPAPKPVSTAVPAVKAGSMTDVEEVLTAAVTLKNSIISEAQTKAEAILADAEKKAADRLGQLSDEQIRLEKQVETLRKTAADYRAGFEKLLQAQQSALDEASDLFE